MTLPKNSFGFHFSTRYIYLLIASIISLTTYSQENSNSEDFWTAIAKKHDLKYDTYTLHENCFIIGEKKVEGDIETFKNVIVISNGSEDYWIYKSETASYDSKTTILKISDCTMEKFKKDLKSLDPEKSYRHINYSINFEKNIATMADVRPDSEIESSIDKIFKESILAGEQIDFEKMNMLVNDKYSAGFINNGKYYTSFDLLFADYKKGTDGIKSQKITIDNKKITILSGNSVLLTANGSYSATTETNNIIEGKFVWTIIYKEIDNEWKVIHTHMSNIR